MAVALDTNNAGGVTAAGTSASFSHTITTASDTWLFIVLGWSALVGSVVVTVDGNAATLIDTGNDTTNSERAQAYAYQITSTGSKSIAVSWTTSARCAYGAVSFTGVDATTPYAASGHINNGTTKPLAQGVTTVAGDAAVIVVASNLFSGNPAWTVDTGDTQIRSSATGTALASFASYELATGTTTTVGGTYTGGTRQYGAVYFAVKQSSGVLTVVASALDASSAPGGGTVVFRDQFVAAVALDGSNAPGSGTVVTLANQNVVTSALDGSNVPGSGTVVIQNVQTIAVDGSSTPGQPTVFQNIIAIAVNGSSAPGNATVQPGNVNVQASALDGSSTPGQPSALPGNTDIVASALDASSAPPSGIVVSGGTIVGPAEGGYRQPR